MIKAASNLSLFKKLMKRRLIFYINNIKVNSAPASDGIPRFMKLAQIILTPLLTKIFNKCIQHEIFPNAFKTAQVIPIPKISSPQSLNDLRHISLFFCLF